MLPLSRTYAKTSRLVLTPIAIVVPAATKAVLRSRDRVTGSLDGIRPSRGFVGALWPSMIAFRNAVSTSRPSLLDGSRVQRSISQAATAAAASVGAPNVENGAFGPV